MDLASGADWASVGKPGGRIPGLEELSLEGRIILKLVFMKQVGGVERKWRAVAKTVLDLRFA
jgi:hypothetical protein